ncbi:MAG: WYL domain-containing protein [Thiobacillus sp.]|nr:WYL domain-containing protein [Thiobacillus sp.]
MNGKHTMRDTFHRQLLILNAIPRYPRKIGTDSIKCQLSSAGHEVSLRTIQRDLVKLAETLPIVCDDAKPGGWSWAKDAQAMDLPALDPHAAVTLQLAKTYLERLLPQATLAHLAPQFLLAAETLDAHGNGLRKWPDKIRVLHRGPNLATPEVNPTAQAELYEGLLKEKQVRIQYRSPQAESAKEYVINPLGLVVRDRITYLVCTFQGYTDPRHIALHRVEFAERLDEPVSVPDGFDLDTFIRNGELDFATGGTIRLRFALSENAAVQLRECPLSVDQEIEPSEEEGYVITTATVQDSWELRWWLLSFGDEAEVLEPASLREVFRQVTVNTAVYYR